MQIHGPHGDKYILQTKQLIVGTKHIEVQEKLLEKGDALASLEAAMDIARTFQATKAHVAQLQAT